MKTIMASLFKCCFCANRANNEDSVREDSRFPDKENAPITVSSAGQSKVKEEKMEIKGTEKIREEQNKVKLARSCKEYLEGMNARVLFKQEEELFSDDKVLNVTEGRKTEGERMLWMKQKEEAQENGTNRGNKVQMEDVKWLGLKTRDEEKSKRRASQWDNFKTNFKKKFSNIKNRRNNEDTEKKAEDFREKTKAEAKLEENERKVERHEFHSESFTTKVKWGITMGKNKTYKEPITEKIKERVVETKRKKENVWLKCKRTIKNSSSKAENVDDAEEERKGDKIIQIAGTSSAESQEAGKIEKSEEQKKEVEVEGSRRGFLKRWNVRFVEGELFSDDETIRVAEGKQSEIERMLSKELKEEEEIEKKKVPKMQNIDLFEINRKEEENRRISATPCENFDKSFSDTRSRRNSKSPEKKTIEEHPKEIKSKDKQEEKYRNIELSEFYNGDSTLKMKRTRKKIKCKKNKVALRKEITQNVKTEQKERNMWKRFKTKIFRGGSKIPKTTNSDKTENRDSAEDKIAYFLRTPVAELEERVEPIFVEREEVMTEEEEKKEEAEEIEVKQEMEEKEQSKEFIEHIHTDVKTHFNQAEEVGFADDEEIAVHKDRPLEEIEENVNQCPSERRKFENEKFDEEEDAIKINWVKNARKSITDRYRSKTDPLKYDIGNVVKTKTVEIKFDEECRDIKSKSGSKTMKKGILKIFAKKTNENNRQSLEAENSRSIKTKRKFQIFQKRKPQTFEVEDDKEKNKEIYEEEILEKIYDKEEREKTMKYIKDEELHRKDKNEDKNEKSENIKSKKAREKVKVPLGGKPVTKNKLRRKLKIFQKRKSQTFEVEEKQEKSKEIDEGHILEMTRGKEVNVNEMARRDIEKDEEELERKYKEVVKDEKSEEKEKRKKGWKIFTMSPGSENAKKIKKRGKLKIFQKRTQKTFEDEDNTEKEKEMNEDQILEKTYDEEENVKGMRSSDIENDKEGIQRKDNEEVKEETSEKTKHKKAWKIFKNPFRKNVQQAIEEKQGNRCEERGCSEKRASDDSVKRGVLIGVGEDECEPETGEKGNEEAQDNEPKKKGKKKAEKKLRWPLRKIMHKAEKDVEKRKKKE